jgi:hypothetical protein
MRNFIQQLILAFLSIGISLVILEIGLRFIDYPRQNCPEIARIYETMFDPLVGWMHRPSQTFAKDFGGTNIINSEGYRSASEDYRTDFSKPIILLVGDSFLFGHGLDFEDTFGFKLKQKLGDKYEVVNFSTQAFGTDQMYLLTQELLPKYHPQFVITNYIEDHDLRNVNQDRRDFYPCLRYPGTKPLFKLIDGKLTQVAAPQTYAVYDRLKIVVAVKKFLNGDLEKKGQQEGHKLSQELLKAMQKTVEEKGAKFYLLAYDAENLQTEQLEGEVLGVTTEDNDPLKYHIPSDITHPNALSNELAVESFLKTFGKDFGFTTEATPAATATPSATPAGETTKSSEN